MSEYEATPSPHILTGEAMRRKREEIGKLREQAGLAIATELERLAALADMTRHPGFPVLKEELDFMLSAAIQSRPKTKAARQDREGTIRAIDLLGHMFRGLEIRAHNLGKEARQ